MTRQKNKTLDEKIRLFITLSVAVLSALSFFLIIFHKEFHALSFPREKTIRLNRTFSILSDVHADDGSIQKLKDNAKESHDLAFQLSDSFEKSTFTCQEDVTQQEFSFSIKGLTEEYFDEFTILGDKGFLKDLIFSANGDVGTVDMKLKDIYLVKYSIDGSYLCFDFLTPSEIFDRIIVIDAACGGKDLGTVKGEVTEKNINLSILLKVKNDFDENQSVLSDGFPKEIKGISGVNINGMKTGIFYTRTDDTDVTEDERTGLANRLTANAFVSIRMNSTASGRMSEIKGAEVLYRVSDADGASKALADKVLSNLLSSLGSNSKGTVAGDEDALIAATKSPVCIVMPGFMTNQEELDLLSTDDYQKKIADAIYEALIE